MQRSTKFLTHALGAVLLVGFAAQIDAKDRGPSPEDGFVMPARSSAKLFPALENWEVDTKTGAAEIRAQNYAGKAPSDKATVFRPVQICRLIDTRDTGTAGAFVINGPLVPPTNIPVTTDNLCGIPATGVAGLSISISALNTTPNNGGFITFLQTGAPLAGVNAVFNGGTIWTAATANIPLPNSSGDFSIVTVQSTIELVVDVNGYYQDLNELDIGTQQFDLNGSGSGTTFGSSNTNTSGTAADATATGASGTALTLNAPGATAGTAVRIFSGRIEVAGAGPDTNESAFVHVADAGAFGVDGNLCNPAGGAFADYSIIDHPYINNNPGALLFITPNAQVGSIASNSAFEAFYHEVQGGCTNAAVIGKWSIKSSANIDHTGGDAFNVLIILP